jgi:soluble epoxide hydrolase/lipid-phosphate phosphatase
MDGMKLILKTAFNGYQTGNRKRSHDHEVEQGNFTITTPTFTLFPTKDPVADWEGLAKQVGEAKWLKNHKTATLPTAHWPQEELPAQFNRILRDWLTSSVYPST